MSLFTGMPSGQVRTVIHRVLALVRSGKAESDLTREIAAHLQLGATR